MCDLPLNFQKVNIFFGLKYMIRLRILSPMAKISHVRRLEVVCKKLSDARAPLEIELICLLEKHNTLITINCLDLGFASQSASTMTSGCAITTTFYHDDPPTFQQGWDKDDQGGGRGRRGGKRVAQTAPELPSSGGGRGNGASKYQGVEAPIPLAFARKNPPDWIPITIR